MKVLSKSLALGALSLALVACGATEEETEQTGAPQEDETEEVSEELEDEDTTEEATEEEESEELEAGMPFTVLESSEDELRVEVDGEEIVHDASIYTTTFGKEVKKLEGMEFEYTEQGQPVAYAVFEEGHFLQDVYFEVEENLILDGDDVITRDVDVENEMNMEERMIANRGHVENAEFHLLDESVPFHFYAEVEGDASRPGHFPENIDGDDYRQYSFYEITENGRYIVTIQVPADVDAEVEATAIALALSYQSDEEISADELEEVEGEEETEDEEDEE
ncbi:hypothetical protein LGQ02_04605 [Bacillus shivajii]|uniref:hypothetical protein n=1 Tax=Bacillus shivajii TaxID=1983719 RepID=UPI001CF96185|nr:hypothetical protein [Bacillus shivajii]UCZ54068.1 hypothetical protein LGQ02_04605 [Bacillus shivajii]